jgi:hypothetical protein
MKTALKVLSYASKIAGLVIAFDWTGISPTVGPIVFFVGSIVKDTVNRVGDFLDDGQVNQSFGK